MINLKILTMFRENILRSVHVFSKYNIDNEIVLKLYNIHTIYIDEIIFNQYLI